ncbi:MAG: hypothetical protein KatS3mg085_686 [Candidatus Dojkabacteria bacterium]|nr:MAG: hypothetical protein KatS3mg085_686 [Candidatus Dojkabacteria bacterium]
MTQLLEATKSVLGERKWFTFFIITTVIILGMYSIAIEFSVSINMFIMANSSIFIILQIVLSVLNAVFGGLAITFIFFLFSKQKQFNGLSSIQSTSSLIFTVGTSGCYICGSLLIPVAGISSAIGTLPFGGIELKILALILFLISLFETAPKILGICDLNKSYILIIGRKTIKINERFFRNLKYLSLSIFTISGFLLLKNFIPREMNLGINSNNYICEYKIDN